jgi:hypothetical protein
MAWSRETSAIRVQPSETAPCQFPELTQRRGVADDATDWLTSHTRVLRAVKPGSGTPCIGSSPIVLNNR